MNNVLFRRGDQTFIDENVPLNDGQIIFNETDEAIYVDNTINGTVVRKRYGGGNLSRSDIDLAFSTISENPIANKVVTNAIGSLSSLQTDVKTNLVGAINEVDTHADYVDSKVDYVRGQVSNAYDEYSPLKAYKIGELCTHDEVLYRCITACSAGSWATNQSCFTSDTLVNVQNMILPNMIAEEFAMNPASSNQTIFSIKGTYTPLDKTVTIIFSCHCSTKVESTNIALDMPAKYRPLSATSGCGMITVDANGQTYGCSMVINPDGRIEQGFSNGYVDAFGIIKYKI